MARGITQVDKQIGETIKGFRRLHGLSQSDLAEKLGVTFQQVQKYEKGLNRVSVSTFILICKTLNVEPMDIIGKYFGNDEDSQAPALIAQARAARSALNQIKQLVDNAYAAA
ncbi:transcriptional regulator with XRE-family HTH domain [Rhizobium sp. BK313]|uniref:helix-turn-helix domain-containing protein n=1 Tax=Rhizobium sp. BK313 TaxID=2587081 RepID=UPI00182683FB|nr:helix-turn-helix transcriptional regulator [Rhizobium sp. BK313]MBB3453929.1 transcriptional regulator with XRE-family HTH domain [Rhizobium sp. BK313]